MSELTFTLLRLGYLVLLWLLVVFAIRVMRRDLADKPGPRPAAAHADPRGALVVAPHRTSEPLPEPAVAAAAAVAAPAPLVGTPAAGVPRTSFRSTLSSDPSPAPAGTPHAAPPPSAAHAATSASTGPRRLLVTEGVLRGTSLPLTSSAILIGRAPSCTLVLDDDYSSSRHARIFPQNGYWYVEDLGSTNGTFVDGRRIEAPVAVHPGEHIMVGQTTMELQR